MPSKLKKAIGAVKDQTSIRLAKVSSNTTSNLEVAVLKATSHDHEVPIDEHYVEEILTLVSSDKSHAAACARAIGKRIGRTRNWVVAIKSLLLVLRIFQDGDPYFPREVIHSMKRGEKILNLSSFRDNSSSSSPWDYTAFVRTFALYLDERLDCFLTGKLQRRRNHNHNHHNQNQFHIANNNDHSRPRRSQSVRVNEPVGEMKPAMLLDKISYWQGLMDRAVATRPTGAAKTNKLIHVTLHAVVHESLDLYKDISDGLALLLDSFFHLPYNSCVSAFQACVKATKQFDELIAFYDLCKSLGVGRPSEYPPVQKISEELLETLKEFLKDKSSFPTTRISPTKSTPDPSAAAAAASGRRHNSCLSELSVETATTNTSSEIQSRMTSRCTSLEDLISAMDSSGKGKRSISIDLEAYSITDIHEFEKQCQRDSTCSGNDDACSAKSLPITSSIDLFDDWPENKDDEDEESETMKSNFDDLLTPKASQLEGWEMVAPSANNLGFSQGQHYNPFLHEPSSSSVSLFEPSFQAAGEISVPTFQAVPTFWAANSNGGTVGNFVNETDPFATFTPIDSSDEGGLNWAQNSPKLLQEQQLWLQQQDKIIAKRIS